MDQYLAVAYFQQGVSNFLLGDFEEALANFNDTLLYLRGNTMIDYAQLGLLFKLYSCEVLFNRGLCYIYLQQKDAGMQDLSYAVKEKVVEDHNVIDEAIREEAEVRTRCVSPFLHLSNNFLRATQYSQSRSASFTGQMRRKSGISRQRIIWARPAWWQHQTVPMPSLALPGLRSETYVLSPYQAAILFWKANSTTLQATIQTSVKDDRPSDNISFAATNLVKPGLQSRRQQSEPPTNRNVFPPTPPPENDRSSASGMSRGASVRNGPKPMPPRLNIEKARPNERFEKESPQDRGARPQRAASAVPSRGYSQREPVRRRQSAEEEDSYPDELYDMYQGGGNGNSRSSRGQGQRRPPMQQYIEEEDEGGSDYDDGSFDEGDFEMVSNRRPGTNSMSSSAGRAMSRRPDIRKIRVKVHAGDVRYIMIGSAVEFPDLVDKIRDKFGIRRRFKIKVKDDDAPEGEMITMGDQDDLEMVIMTVKQQARKQRLDTGKMEVSLTLPYTNTLQ